MRRDEVLLRDLITACEDILTFIEGMDDRSFYSDLKTQSAVQHQFTVLGEATKRLSLEFRTAHPEIQWREMAGMRDRLIHAYEAVDLGIVWLAIQDRIPGLLMALNALIPKDSGPS